MSNFITEAFVQQFGRNVFIDSQQRGSRIRPVARLPEEKVTGEACSFERIGTSEAQDVTTRHADTPVMNTPHKRRWALMADKEWGDMIDKLDVAKTLNDPRNSYTQSGTWAMGRKIDDILITAMLGDALEGKNLSDASKIALPAAQQIAAAAVGMTVAKLNQAREIRESANVPDEYKWFLIWGPKQKTDLLNTTQATSSDYNTVKSLVNGQINEFLGFTFITSTRLPKSGTDRQCIAVAQNGAGLGINADITVKMSEDPGKRYALRPYIQMSMGAVRIEDVQVIRIDCKE